MDTITIASFTLYESSQFELLLQGNISAYLSTLFRGVVPSDPPTTYKWLFSTDTATPSLRVFILGTLLQRLVLGSYLTVLDKQEQVYE